MWPRPSAIAASHRHEARKGGENPETANGQRRIVSLTEGRNLDSGQSGGDIEMKPIAAPLGRPLSRRRILMQGGRLVTGLFASGVLGLAGIRSGRAAGAAMDMSGAPR